jgi:hypothetical protein
MKIMRAWVYDPTVDGHLDPPQLYVETDSYPDQTLDWIHADDDWQQAKYGPFVAFERERTTDYDAGDYNVRFAGQFPPVVDITLVVGSQVYFEMFSLPLTRARQLVRKHASDWRLYLDDHEAQSGSMLWLPRMTKPRCRWWMTHRKPPSVCNSPEEAMYVRKDGIDFPVCPKHLQDHNNLMANRRRAS